MGKIKIHQKRRKSKKENFLSFSPRRRERERAREINFEIENEENEL